jgi:ATP-binding cassette subfamily B protein
MSTHLRLLVFLKPYMKQVILAITIVTLAAAFTMVMPQIIQWSIDTGLKPPNFVETEAQLAEHLDGSSSATSLTVDSTAGLTNGQVIKIDNEEMRIVAATGTTLSVERGIEGTRIRSHIAGRTVYQAGRTSFGGDTGTLLIGGGLLITVAALRGFFTYWQTFLGEWLGQHAAFDLRNMLYNQLQHLSYAYHDKQQTGQLMSRATQDVEGTRQFLQMGVLRLFDMTLRIVIAAFFMFSTDWRLSLVAWAFLPIVAINSARVSLLSRKLWMEIQERLGRVTTVLQENLSGVRVVKAFSREEYEEAKFNKQAEDLFTWNYRQNRVQAINTPFYMGMSMLAQVAVLWWGATLVTRGDLTAGQLFAFIIYLGLLLRPMQMLGFIVQQFARAGAAGDRIFEVLDAESAVKEKPDAIVLRDVEGHVRFEHVSFGYDAISAVLTDVDFQVDPDKVVALLGPTGSGKTTVVNLLPRFYDVTGGSIKVDGIDIRDVTLASLRANIGIIQQDVFLFSATIRDNIAYGAVNATYEQIIEAAKIARVHDFIMSLPDGYDTWVGERGITLSGGQKQRISIARTLLLDPKILILDDSTSSVDTQTEYLIQQALAAVMKGRTTLVIAQRLRTVKNADQILVMKDGAIAERGTHDELIAIDGLYREIYDLELRDQEEALQRAAGGVAIREVPLEGGNS